MGFQNTALNLLFNPVGIFEEAGKALNKATSGPSTPAPVAPLPLPAAPDTSAIAAQAQQTIQQRKASMDQSIYTSPLGISGQANVVRKTLLGQ